MGRDGDFFFASLFSKVGKLEHFSKFLLREEFENVEDRQRMWLEKVLRGGREKGILSTEVYLISEWYYLHIDEHTEFVLNETLSLCAFVQF
jgi:hypothetical protein